MKEQEHLQELERIRLELEEERKKVKEFKALQARKEKIKVLKQNVKLLPMCEIKESVKENKGYETERIHLTESNKVANLEIAPNTGMPD